MRTNKACPLYSGASGQMNVALTEEQEEEIQSQMNQVDEELVNLEDTKVTLSGKLIKVISIFIPKITVHYTRKFVYSMLKK